MPLLNDIKDSLSSYVEALRLIRQGPIRTYFLLSFIFYVIALLCSAWLLWLLVEAGTDYLLGIEWIKRYADWLKGYPWLLWITRIAVFLSLGFLLLSVFKFIFLTLASPLFAFLSEKTAEVINHTSYPFSVRQLLFEIQRGIVLNARNFIRQNMRTVPLLFLSFIPIAGIFFGLLIILTDSYYYGFSMIDYNCERHKIGSSASIQLIKSRKGLAIGNGLLLYLSLLIPILGVAFFAPLSVIAATITFYKTLHKDP